MANSCVTLAQMQQEITKTLRILAKETEVLWLLMIRLWEQKIRMKNVRIKGNEKIMEYRKALLLTREVSFKIENSSLFLKKSWQKQSKRDRGIKVILPSIPTFLFISLSVYLHDFFFFFASFKVRSYSAILFLPFLFNSNNILFQFEYLAGRWRGQILSIAFNAHFLFLLPTFTLYNLFLPCDLHYRRAFIHFFPIETYIQEKVDQFIHWRTKVAPYYVCMM